MVIDVRHQDNAWGFLSIKNLPDNVGVSNLDVTREIKISHS